MKICFSLGNSNIKSLSRNGFALKLRDTMVIDDLTPSVIVSNIGRVMPQPAKFKCIRFLLYLMKLFRLSE